jgi:hypothetical protein
MSRRRKDLALVYAPTEDGDGYRILRQRRGSGRVEAGELRPMRSGHAIVGEVLKLRQRKESPFLFDAETDEELSTAVAPEPAPAPTAGGPPQVATERYRRGWDATWGRGPRARATDVN